MTDGDWDTAHIKSVAVFLNGAAIGEPDDRGEHVVDDSFFIMFNAHHEPIDFFVPDLGLGDSWRIELDTAAPRVQTDQEATVRTKEWLTVAGRSITAISMAAAT